MTRTETDEEIRFEASGYCRYCNGSWNGHHVHVWTKPKRCEEAVQTFEGGYLQCERDAGHDAGPFPRLAWNHGLDNVSRFIVNPTPHVASWT